MSDLPDREAFSPRFAVRHELTDEGLRIVADQVVTADAATGLPIDNPPLGELVQPGPVVPEEGGGDGGEGAAQAEAMAQAEALDQDLLSQGLDQVAEEEQLEESEQPAVSTFGRAF